jgi:hypothetical protein
MSARARTGGQKPPEPGASRAYVLTPVNEPDVVAWAIAKQRSIGWTVLEEDWRLGARDDVWVMVELWAIPPASGRG